jgi:hypothetical protein
MYGAMRSVSVSIELGGLRRRDGPAMGDGVAAKVVS